MFYVATYVLGNEICSGYKDMLVCSRYLDVPVSNVSKDQYFKLFLLYFSFKCLKDNKTCSQKNSLCE